MLLVRLSVKSIEKFGPRNLKSTNKVVNGTPTPLRSVGAHYHWRYIDFGFRVSTYDECEAPILV